MLLLRFIDFTVQSTATKEKNCSTTNEIAMFDMPTAILDNTFKTTTPFIDTKLKVKVKVSVFYIARFL